MHARGQALARLCQTYWYPLYAFARRYGYGPEDARDLTLIRPQLAARPQSGGKLLLAVPGYRFQAL